MLAYDQPIGGAKPDNRQVPGRTAAGFNVLQLTELALHEFEISVGEAKRIMLDAGLPVRLT